MDSVSTVRDLAHVAELLKAHDHYVIVPHVAPDPDAFGAACGLAILLTRLGKTVRVYTDEAVPENCAFLAQRFPIDHTLPDIPEDWKLIFVDGGELKREPAPVRAWPTWLNLDHHTENGQFARWIYVDTAVASCSMIISRLADPLGVPFDEASATCLFAGTFFDTRNSFTTDRSTPEVFAMMARLVEAGARPDQINGWLNEQMTMADFQLYGAALAGMKTACDGRVVYAALSQPMIEASGGSDQAMEMLTLNLPKIAGGEIFVLFKEREPGVVKLSFRSKGRLAVNTVAKQFDGGGHKFAAGGRVDAPLDEVIARVIAACEAAVHEQANGAAR